MAEGARLESVYTGNRIVGSNPLPPPIALFTALRSRPPPATKTTDTSAYLSISFLFTRPSSFAIVRLIFVDRTGDYMFDV